MHAEVHFFHSGNGDTILVRGGDEWGLVDANFVKYLSVRDRVEKTLEGVERLRFVCVTHFDLDHIRGLAAFLRERFSDVDDSGSRIWRIDQIIQPLAPMTLVSLRQLKLLARQAGDSRPTSFSVQAADLISLFEEMALTKEGKVKPKKSTPQFVSMAPQTFLPLPLNSQNSKTRMGPWRIVGIGPRSQTIDAFSALRLDEAGAELRVKYLLKKVQSNSVSRILTLVHETSGSTMLLTGDSTDDELAAAISEWRIVTDGSDDEFYPFNFVKVSHHGGAKPCHFEPLYSRHCSKHSGGVVICAADDGDHPHHAVIECLNSNMIDRRITGAPQVNKPLSCMPNVPLGAPVFIDQPQDVVIRFDESEPQWTGGKRSSIHDTQS